MKAWRNGLGSGPSAFNCRHQVQASPTTLEEDNSHSELQFHFTFRINSIILRRTIYLQHNIYYTIFLKFKNWYIYLFFQFWDQQYNWCENEICKYVSKTLQNSSKYSFICDNYSNIVLAIRVKPSLFKLILILFILQELITKSWFKYLISNSTNRL